MLTKARGLAAGQLAKAAGVNLETIRYYETIGLMPAPPRTPGGHRVYDDVHVRRLAFIRRGRELGFSIEEVRALLILNDPRQGSCAEVKDIAAMHVNWPPFRPDSRHNAGGLRLSSSTGLWLTIIDGSN